VAPNSLMLNRVGLTGCAACSTRGVRRDSASPRKYLQIQGKDLDL